MAISFGEIRTKFIADDSEWQPGLGRIAAGVSDLQSTSDGALGEIKSNLSDTAGGLTDVGDAAGVADGQLTFASAATAGVAALSAIAGALDGVRREIADAGAQADDLRDRLAGPFKETSEEIAKLAEAQLVLGFKPEEIENALINMNRLGLEPTQANLTALEDISRGTGKSVETLAEKFGRVNEYADPKAILAFEKELGATGPQLEKFGAKIDANNKVLTDTPARADAARQALLQFAAVEFGGAADRVADDATRLEGEFQLLTREIGAGSVQLKEAFAPALRGVVAVIRELPPGLKGAVGAGLELTSGLASMGVGALGVATNLAILSTNAQAMAIATRAATLAQTAFNVAVGALTGTLGGVILVLGSAAIGLALYTAAIQESTRAEEALIAIEEKQNRTLQENRDLLNKSAEDLLKMGKSSKDVAGVLDGLRNQVEAARSAGNKELEARLIRQVEAAEKVKSELATAEAKAREAKKTPPDDTSSKEQTKLDKQAETERKRADAERKKSERETSKALEQQRKDALAEELAQVRGAAAAKEISIQQEIDGLRRILGAVKVTAAERRQIEAEIARLNGQLEQQKTAELKKAEAERTRATKAEADQRARDNAKAEAQARAESKKNDTTAAQDAKKAEAEAKANEDKVAALKSQSRAAQEKILDNQIRDLEQDAEKRGVNNLERIKALLAQRLGLEIQAIEAERDATTKRAENEDVRAAAVEAAENRIEAARSAATQKLKAETDKQTKIQADAKKAQSGSAFADGPFGVADLAKQLGSIFGDKAVTDQINRNRAASSLGQVRDQSNSVQATSAKNPNVSTAQPGAALKAADIGSEVAKNLQEKLAITLTVVNQDGSQQSKTFSGTRDELAKAKNIFNPANTLGRV